MSYVSGGVQAWSQGSFFPMGSYIVGQSKTVAYAPFAAGCELVVEGDPFLPETAAAVRDRLQHLKRLESLADSAVAQLLSTGGFSVSLDPSQPVPQQGFAASAEGFERVLSYNHSLCYPAVFKYIFDHCSWASDSGVPVIGGWVFEGNLYLDCSVIFNDRQSAVAFGVANNQLAYYDIEAGESVQLK